MRQGITSTILRSPSRSAMREAETNITLSTRYACSYHRGGLDNVWAI